MIYMISGHGDVDQEEFNKTYKVDIDLALKEDSNAKFILGDFKGVDSLAQSRLSSIYWRAE